MGLEADVAQLRRGDLDALSTLVSRYQNRLFRFLLICVNQRPSAVVVLTFASLREIFQSVLPALVNELERVTVQVNDLRCVISGIVV